MSLTAQRSEGVGPLPSGTVTFAFTDVEGSTERWERDRAAMESAVRRHDGLMRSAIEQRGGSVFKTIGDAFCAAFARPEDAVAAMLEAQRAIAADDFSAVGGLRVRAAVHTGTADERSGDYFGPAVNRVARLLAIGHGGQVLVSGVTADLVQGSLSPESSLQDLGAHRLKDLARPEQVYQLIAPGLESDFGALRSLDALPNNLPLQPTSFVGREAEIAAITGLLAKHRLVTLVGSGGVGKTRCSLQVGANLLDGSGDGVWFIELAAMRDGALLPSAIAQVLDIRLPAGGDPVAHLAKALRRYRVLLILDNCEHLIAAASAVAGELLRSCPDVTILASSRQGLGVAGEATYRMPSLTFPSSAQAGTLTSADAKQYGAIALFAERAATADPDFELTEENAPVVADICRRLDGISLAIELAAARIRMLSPDELRSRLDQRFRLLTGGSRDVLPRQQTLRALIDWSYELLDEDERDLFERLGIFVDGFTLAGAVAVAGEGAEELTVFDRLAALVDKSLVIAEAAGKTTRYRLLESTRAYARERLDESARLDALKVAHFEYLRDHFDGLWQRYEKSARASEYERNASELEDVRAAAAWAFENLPHRAAELVAVSGRLFIHLGLDHELLSMLEAAKGACDKNDRLLARLLIMETGVAGNCAYLERAVAAGERAVELSRQLGDQKLLAQALISTAYWMSDIGRMAEAQAAVQEALTLPIATALQQRTLILTRSWLASATDDFDLARKLYEQEMRECQARGERRAFIVSSMNLAEAEHAAGETERAVAIATQASEKTDGVRDRMIVVNIYLNLTAYLLHLGRLDAACSTLREAMAIVAKGGAELSYAAIALGHTALYALLRGDNVAQGARLMAYTDARMRFLRIDRQFTERQARAQAETLMLQLLTPAERERFADEGAALSPEEALSQACAIIEM